MDSKLILGFVIFVGAGLLSVIVKEVKIARRMRKIKKGMM